MPSAPVYPVVPHHLQHFLQEHSLPGQEAICKGIKAEEVLSKMRAVIEAEPLAKIDYVSMVDALDMQPVESVEKDVLVAMAVYIGKTRLIDNFSYEV